MKTILENLMAALEIVNAEPEEKIDLASWRSDYTRCGTLHCALGLCATKPYFNDQGLIADGAGTPRNIYDADRNTFIDKLFGPKSYLRLFPPYGAGEFDDELLFGKCMSDKSLAIARLQLAIAQEHARLLQEKADANPRSIRI